MAVFSCQLKKLEAEKKTYEVATEKLLQFAEVQRINSFLTFFDHVSTMYLGICKLI